MSIALKPITEPNGNISPIFNLNNFYRTNDYASKADHLNYANLYNANFFQYLNTLLEVSMVYQMLYFHLLCIY